MVNRCQEDINQRRSIRDALASEAAFFQSHPEYAAVASRCSTSALSHTVSSILSAHIQALDVPARGGVAPMAASAFRTEHKCDTVWARQTF